MPKGKSEVRELSLLLEISRILDRSLDLRDVLHPVLKAMADNLGIIRGAVTLLNRESGEMNIEIAYGFTEKQKRRGRYKKGEGVVGQVVETGAPLVVPRISQEPRFLDRTGARKKRDQQEITFICVPIMMENEVIGALSVDQPFREGHNPDEDLRLLRIVASMIARAVRLRQSAQEKERRLREENLRLQEELKNRFRPSNIIGNSHRMQEVYRQILQVCKGDTTVLLRGETGVGKELVAHAIHYNSRRAAGPFIKVNCSALPETVIESELFGHEKGAFTGAISTRRGRFELAGGGTLFLDEIGDLPPGMQIKILRVLQEKEFERVGGTQTLKADVRIIAATNRDLEQLIQDGRFREDLYYRLNVFPIHIPPLRERRSDLLLLADHFVEKYNRIQNRKVKRISTPAIDMIMAYHWPGNVRELENCIERAMLMSRDDVIHGHHLPPTLQTGEASGTGVHGSLRETLDRVEREMIVEALKETRGNMNQAAKILGITERIMGLRVKKYRIDFRRFRTGAPAVLHPTPGEKPFTHRW